MADSPDRQASPALLKALKGNRRDLLVALRHRLAIAFDDPRTQPRDLSPLSLRLLELHREIQTIDDAKRPLRAVKDPTFRYEDI